MIRVAGVGGIGLNGDVENTFNWAPRLGLTYQLNQKTVIRGGYGRSYDIGVFGSLFGHSVTQNLPVLSIQNLNAPENFDRVFNLAGGPPPPVFPDVPDSGEFPLPNGVFARALPEKQRPPHVDAFNLTVQRELTPTMSIEVGYVGNRGGNVFAGDGPAININQASINGYPGVPRNQRRPYFNAVRLDAGRRLLLQLRRRTAYDSLQAKLTKRFADGYSLQVNYTLQRAEQESGEYFQTPLPPAAGLFDTALNRGPADWDRTHNLVISLVAELPIGRGRAYLTDVSPAMNLLVGGWQFNANTFILSGLPFNVSYRNAGADRDTGPESSRSHRRSGGTGNARPVVQRHADRRVRERVRQASRRNVRQPRTERAARPGLLAGRRVDVQELRVRRGPGARGADRGGEPLQPRQSRQPRFGGRGSGQPEPERRPNHVNGVRRQ